jgi:hypothetical protein
MAKKAKDSQRAPELATEQFTEGLGVKIRPSQMKELERIAVEMFSDEPGAFSKLVRRFLQQGIDAAKQAAFDKELDSTVKSKL